MTFKAFSSCVIANALLPERYSDKHWQIRGGKFIVDFHLTGKGVTVCVNSLNVRNRYRKADRALQAAIEVAHAIIGPGQYCITTKSRNRPRTKRGKAIKAWLFAKSDRCYWCDHPLTLAVDGVWSENLATLEHLIPLSKGGTNGLDNLALACAKCNNERASEEPARALDRQEPESDDGAAQTTEE